MGMTNQDRAMRAAEAFFAVEHDDNDALTNIGDLMANLCHFADQFVEFDIIDEYTEQKVDNYIARSATDALAQFSIDHGFADPRETAVELTERVPPHGSTEGDPFYLRPDGLVGMIYTNTCLYAKPTEDRPEGWGLTMIDRALMHYKAEVAEAKEDDVALTPEEAWARVAELINGEREAAVEHNAYLDPAQIVALEILLDETRHPKTGVPLTEEQRVFLCDLLSHDSDLISDLVGYADEADGQIDQDGWFQKLINSTRLALGTSAEAKQHRHPTMTASHQKMADRVLQGLELVQLALACLEELGVSVQKQRIAEDEPFYSTDRAIDHLKDAEEILENA